MQRNDKPSDTPDKIDCKTNIEYAKILANEMCRRTPSSFFFGSGVGGYLHSHKICKLASNTLIEIVRDCNQQDTAMKTSLKK